jgi:radical SAM enzyme (TIGR01210 family)
VERLWRRREYQPPWLWTVLEALKRTAGQGPRVISAPSGGGTRRGAHNCGQCDRSVIKAIERFSLSGSVEDLNVPDCRCIDLWRDQLELEDHVHGPLTLDRRTFHE